MELLLRKILHTSWTATSSGNMVIDPSNVQLMAEVVLELLRNEPTMAPEKRGEYMRTLYSILCKTRHVFTRKHKILLLEELDSPNHWTHFEYPPFWGKESLNFYYKQAINGCFN